MGSREHLMRHLARAKLAVAVRNWRAGFGVEVRTCGQVPDVGDDMRVCGPVPDVRHDLSVRMFAVSLQRLRGGPSMEKTLAPNCRFPLWRMCAGKSGILFEY